MLNGKNKTKRSVSGDLRIIFWFSFYTSFC